MKHKTPTERDGRLDPPASLFLACRLRKQIRNVYPNRNEKGKQGMLNSILAAAIGHIEKPLEFLPCSACNSVQAV